MITSWNVNQFLRTRNWTEFDEEALKKSGKSDEEIQEIRREKENIQNECSKEIKCLIKKRYAAKEQDLIFLHEVPNDLAWKIQENVNRWLDLNDNKYECLLPYKTAPKTHFQTLAIFMEGKYEYNETYTNNVEIKFAFNGTGFRNRILALNPKNKKSEIICGVHVPPDEKECPVYYESLIGLHNKFKEAKAKTIYYIGDFNAFLPNKINKRKMHDLMALGLEDYWLATGNSNNSPTHLFGERIDYVLAYRNSRFKNLEDYQKYFNKYEMTVDPKDIADKGNRKESLLSDHSAIILKERTPEMKKTGD
ncbi:endonuclease/exonuclease/phosphatase family protein [Ruminococcus sp.]|uniref:endonuclease/exonuclease/phosphatase family protein n=1 Tax=Ruminococcus sp. TaxID=41978 RepID=UPI0025F9265A|nr:endonuclease/exonuclease/phosphatase family protein [Ruminococcus sp.]MBQ8966906.1 endonuclease/exonuclease/phosphatase family protein [Ruminococcus sp.]